MPGCAARESRSSSLRVAMVRLAITGALLWTLAMPALALEPGAKPLHVTLQDGRLSVHAEAVPCSEILSRIIRLTDIAVDLGTAVPASLSAEPVTIAFFEVTLDEALRRLLPGRNLVFVYGDAGLARVHLYGDRGPADGAAMDEPGGVSGLVKQALGDADARQRLSALERLSGGADAGALRDTALAILERERDARVLDGALDVLAELESLPLDPLIRFLHTSRDTALRLRALAVLGQSGRGDPRVIELLRATAARAQDAEISESARDLLSAADE